MTEEMWLGTTDPVRMYELIVRLNRKRRKWRLAITAACRRVSTDYPFSEVICLDALSVAEQFADGKTDEAELAAAHFKVRELREELSLWYQTDLNTNTVTPYTHPHARETPFVVAVIHATLPSETLFGPHIHDVYGVPGTVESVQQLFPPVGDRRGTLACVFREVFENPFRTVAFDPQWRTTDAMLLARGIYATRDFGAMPILADALQDAGCANDDLLNHLRDTSLTHARGCWALDLVLGKE